MNFTRLLATALLVGALPSAALATPTLRYSWDACDPVVTNKDFAGQGHYHQVLSATGLTGSYTYYRIYIYIGRGNPPAWFCAPLGVSGNAAGCASIPGIYLQAYLSPFLTDPTRAFIEVSGYFNQPFVPDPATRYTLADLDYDLGAATTGFGGPCGGADAAQCFHVVGAVLYRADYSTDTMDLESGFVTWQDAGNSLGCPGATPTSAGTWGRLKQIYR